MGARFSMLCGCCCLCPLQGSGSSMVWEQSSIACGCFCLCPLWAACALFRFQGPAWYGCKVQHAVWMLLSSMVCDGVWELLPLPFSGFRGSAWGVGAIGCALYGSGSCGSCCLCPCGWSALAIVGAVACSHFKEGQAWGAVVCLCLQGGVQVSTDTLALFREGLTWCGSCCLNPYRRGTKYKSEIVPVHPCFQHTVS